MLDTQFYRPIGDIGNPDTFSFPVRYKKVEGASVSRVVIDADRTILEPFVRAAKEFEREGVKAITTSCGFLAIYQQAIQQQLQIPFYASSLLIIPFAAAIVGEPIGIVTASQKSLTTAHLQGVRADGYDVVVQGMDAMPAFTGAIINETIELDEALIKEEMKLVVTQLIEHTPHLRAIVLECTNMPPYISAIREVTNLPVFDITTLTNYINEII